MVVSISKLNMSTNIMKIFDIHSIVFVIMCTCVHIYLITDLFIYKKRFWLIYGIIHLRLSRSFLLPVGNSLLISHFFMFCTIKLLVL